MSDSPYLVAAGGGSPERTPVWFMRQAGRSLPEYRSKRGPGSILDAIKIPDLAIELTLQPVRRYGVDAAILYSDIMVPLHAIGFGVDIEPGVGPVVTEPFQRTDDLQRIRPLEPGSDTPYVLETIQGLVSELEVPLIGFAGAPFTLASYLIEGKPTRDWTKTKALMTSEPVLWMQFMDRLAQIVISSLKSQVAAGASAIQLFDSWAGALSPTEYERYVLPSVQHIFAAINELDIPSTIFGVNTKSLLGLFSGTGAGIIGVDWHVSLSEAARLTGHSHVLQGNLDPSVVVEPWPVVKSQVELVLKEGAAAPGHIFNLGHGVLPQTDPAVLERVVAVVHGEDVIQ